MTATKHWTVDVYIDEHDDDSTRAEARLHTRDAGQITGVGFARRNPHDVNVPEIGDELATSRALADLAQRLLHTTSEDIEDVTHKPARLWH
jgi:hypothetical protein